MSSHPEAQPPALATAAEPGGRTLATFLVSRTADFWLLGGLSIVAWCVLRFFQPFLSPASPPTIGNFARTYFAHLAGAGAIASLLLNYPHFMASYRLAYSPGLPHVRRHWFSLVAVPFALLAAITLGWVAWRSGAGSVAPVSSAFTSLGISSPFPDGVSIGGASMAALVHVLMLATGWHYGKQAYGACLIYARFDGYALDDSQRTLLRWAIHGVWMSKWVQRLSPASYFDFHGVVYSGLAFPRFVLVATTLVAGALILGVLVFIVLANHRRTGQLPSANAAVPFIAFLVWWFPPLYNETFTSNLVPIFHGLQYMTFVARVETAGVAGRDERSANAKLTFLAFAMVITGVLAFELIPKSLDAWSGTAASMNALFFMAAVAVFLNLHHYCIDAAIWRMRDPRVRDVLFFRPAA